RARVADPRGRPFVTKRQRGMAALRGQPVDRVPLSFWLHNFATENSAQGLADETLRLAGAFDRGFPNPPSAPPCFRAQPCRWGPPLTGASHKPQSRAQCFAEMWGLTYRPSGELATPYTVTHAPVVDADDLARLPVADPREGALGEQLEALRLIPPAVGPALTTIWTVFAPPL